MTHYIQEAELDLAVSAGVVEITRYNARPVRCARAGCRRLCGIGQARRVFVDGHKRGYLCEVDVWGILTSIARKGNTEL